MIKYKTIHLDYKGCWVSRLEVSWVKSSNDRSIINCKRCIKKDKQNLLKDMMRSIDDFILFADNKKINYARVIKLFININKNK